jgi:hypothetical protein
MIRLRGIRLLPNTGHAHLFSMLLYCMRTVISRGECPFATLPPAELLKRYFTCSEQTLLGQIRTYRIDPLYDVHRAVHRNIIPIVKPTRCTSVPNFFIFEWHSTCFRPSISSSSGLQDCTYINQTENAVCLLAGR